jgi:hypothetical protein
LVDNLRGIRNVTRRQAIAHDLLRGVTTTV